MNRGVIKLLSIITFGRVRWAPASTTKLKYGHENTYFSLLIKLDPAAALWKRKKLNTSEKLCFLSVIYHPWLLRSELPVMSVKASIYTCNSSRITPEDDALSQRQIWKEFVDLHFKKHILKPFLRLDVSICSGLIAPNTPLKYKLIILVFSRTYSFPSRSTIF